MYLFLFVITVLYSIAYFAGMIFGSTSWLCMFISLSIIWLIYGCFIFCFCCVFVGFSLYVYVIALSILWVSYSFDSCFFACLLHSSYLWLLFPWLCMFLFCFCCIFMIESWFCKVIVFFVSLLYRIVLMVGSWFLHVWPNVLLVFFIN